MSQTIFHPSSSELPIPTLLLPILIELGVKNSYIACSGKLETSVLMRKRGFDIEQIAYVKTKDVLWLAEQGYISKIRTAQILIYKITELGKKILLCDDLKKHMPRFHTKIAHTQTIEDLTPIKSLSRKSKENGASFLSENHILAAYFLERDYLLSGLDSIDLGAVEDIFATYPQDKAQARAHQNLCDALKLLHPDMAELCFRCCCFKEGIQTVEQALNWSARSGKIVLRLALDLLATHYQMKGEFEHEPDWSEIL